MQPWITTDAEGTRTLSHSGTGLMQGVYEIPTEPDRYQIVIETEVEDELVADSTPNPPRHIRLEVLAVVFKTNTTLAETALTAARTQQPISFTITWHRSPGTDPAVDIENLTADDMWAELTKLDVDTEHPDDFIHPLTSLGFDTELPLQHNTHTFPTQP